MPLPDYITDKAPIEVSSRFIADDNYVLNEIKKLLFQSTDAFGRGVRLNSRNVADLASHYKFSPERFRLFVDDTRQFIQYDGFPAQYEKQKDVHVLKPQAANEAVELETTEIYRYVVGYVIEVSFAFQTNQRLQSGDILVIGYGEPDLANATGENLGPSADGWFFVWDGSLADNEVRLVQARDGTIQDDRTVTTSELITDWARYAQEVNWYAVGATRFTETFTDDNEQINKRIGRTGIEDERSARVGNHHVTIGINPGAASAGNLEIELGSVGVRLLGDTNPILRRKTNQFTATINTANTFVPIHGFRIEPNEQEVNVELTDIRVPKYTANGDIIVVAYAFDIAKLQDSGGNPLDDTDFSAPPLLSMQNSVIQTTSNIARFPNNSGTIVTSTTNPGGYQEGFGSNYDTQGSGKSNPSQQARRLISERDVVVFLARSTTASGTVKVEYVTEQQW